ncbi:Homeobox-leucine zipper protein HAT4 [Platanthera guangdongensis]|uniref:Homeobox-leucine zipper protein HAT4 n=1 Tax=Platanthera guangdongensis TaxID=2320717 RepID=A0ABR2LMG2_9ASPA
MLRTAESNAGYLAGANVFTVESTVVRRYPIAIRAEDGASFSWDRRQSFARDGSRDRGRCSGVAEQYRFHRQRREKRRYDICDGIAGGGEEIDADRACSRGLSDEDDGEGSRKKLRLSKDQAAILEESFKENNTLNPKQKLALANKLNLRPRQVEVWFQNRRARTKLKQTEVDCEFLKLCCDNLTEENRRLQKEVQELRALKLSPQFYSHMTPPTTLTMCPSCERIAVSNPSASAPPPAAKFSRTTRPPATGALPPWAPIMLRPSFLHATAKP